MRIDSVLYSGARKRFEIPRRRTVKRVLSLIFFPPTVGFPRSERSSNGADERDPIARAINVLCSQKVVNSDQSNNKHRLLIFFQRELRRTQSYRNTNRDQIETAYAENADRWFRQSYRNTATYD